MENLGVLISGNGSTLQALIDGSQNNVKLSVVISSKPNAYGLLRAKRAGIPTFVLPENLRKNKEKAEEWIIQKLREFKVTKVFLAGFMRVLTPKFIEAYKSNLYNIHPSLLPLYKGIDGFGDALKAGEKKVGCTIHNVISEVDGGEIILQRRFDVPESRDEELSRLWLHIQESRVLRNGLRRVLWHNQ